MFRKVRLEATPICQLNCPSCSTAKGQNTKFLGKGFLSAMDFQRFVSLNPELEFIELSNYGEIFLNRDLSEIVSIAHSNGVKLTAMNGVNLNSVKGGILEDLVKYGFSEMLVSIDGASNETYEIYRRRGNFDKVIENIKKINFYKTKYNSQFPMLHWQFVVFGHNEHELPLAKKMAKDLDMNFIPKKSWDEVFSPIKNPQFVREQTNWQYATRTEEAELNKMDEKYYACRQLWSNPQINWDGRVLGCCCNIWNDFGVNAFTAPLNEILKGGNIGYARDMLTGKAPSKREIPCYNCKKYKLMEKTGSYLEV
ncbi:radical SAM/SPASM domain-containing protein [Reinekea marinisedimentorum]|uniref:MoaA/NifB/PqqE/SkfB family radical SAM enzyme n=1 Tax=Reinekea marinisedimentorum TaxID=230495 RepID=A0A4R3HWR4_9GAMM|nr:radical SAM protein [Reinekea marinisedimentorum]TCS36701.1 MoaA/NifB/PqqE/SkfB family radical SAM enzyme [Reinekea marinisedimentorum]